MILAHFSPVILLADGATTPPGLEEMTTATVTPGLPGFFVFLAMAVAMLLLALDLSRRVRRSSARENVRRRMEEAAEAERGESRNEAERS
ncbi:hypothetical protein DAD186_06000 [Dermabacter vaginalis]|uniref:Uncharacterized protein n=1 Tax=Dermabacter vaginalis TaxID=1630135 RepID=A0A1B0ZGM7_9MICO|nr:hypothetical protein [Dermabacter vaginalis]ANP27155.1 hypothetical protein DAD186_06000 [Dermabacter vaginalis]